MTGRELIIYILSNHLEDELIFKDGKIMGYMTADEAAVKFGVTKTTIQLWYGMGYIPGMIIGTELYIPVNAEKE